MKSYNCRVCENRLFFENSVCVSCGTAVGYSRDERALVPVDGQGRYVDAAGLIWHMCRNLNLSGCTWLAPLEGGQCFSCALTRTRPNDADAAGLENFVPAERAKRHLIAELDGLGVPIVGKTAETGGDQQNGLCFDLLSSVSADVTIGQADGVITIDLAESDDAYREKVREQLDEPYRTMLGHFRHEVGHYYEWQLVRGDALTARCRELFGDERVDYQAEIDRHYAEGPPAGWRASYLSAYATMHPWEDFAESWAHVLHIHDSIETAREYGLLSSVIELPPSFRDVVTQVWMPLSVALNAMNQAMGRDHLYPFVLPEPVVDKMAFVDELISGAGAEH